MHIPFTANCPKRRDDSASETICILDAWRCCVPRRAAHNMIHALIRWINLSCHINAASQAAVLSKHRPLRFPVSPKSRLNGRRAGGDLTGEYLASRSDQQKTRPRFWVNTPHESNHGIRLNSHVTERTNVTFTRSIDSFMPNTT